jgi:hypothetical protein
MEAMGNAYNILIGKIEDINLRETDADGRVILK